MERLCNKQTFSFTYNGIIDKTKNLGHDINQFWPKQNVVAKFNTYAINFKSIAKLDGMLNYNYRF